MRQRGNNVCLEEQINERIDREHENVMPLPTLSGGVSAKSTNMLKVNKLVLMMPFYELLLTTIQSYNHTALCITVAVFVLRVSLRRAWSCKKNLNTALFTR